MFLHTSSTSTDIRMRFHLDDKFACFSDRSSSRLLCKTLQLLLFALFQLLAYMFFVRILFKKTRVISYWKISLLLQPLGHMQVSSKSEFRIFVSIQFFWSGIIRNSESKLNCTTIWETIAGNLFAHTINI